MAQKKVIKPVALAVGAALAGSFAISGAVNAADTADSPFSISSLKVGYMLDEHEGSCGSDHEKEGDRIRGWLEGTVVQVDPKMLAVQFRENVYLTDGWMVPDHVLWCPKDSQNIRRPMKRRRKPRPRPL